MNIKGNEVIGKKILTEESGEQIDTVKDIIYDPTQHKVRALLVKEGGWFSDAKIIPMDEVNSIGKDAVMVSNKDVIRDASEISDRISHIAKDDTYLTKTKIVTQEGNELGEVSDIVFDAATGKVSEFEVSQGAIRNIRSGKKLVRVNDIVTVGKDTTIVRGYTDDNFRKQAEEQGVQGFITKGISQIQEKTQEVAKKTRKTARDAGRQVEEKTRQFKDKGREKYRELREEGSGETVHMRENAGSKAREIRSNPKIERTIFKARENVSQAGESIGEAARQMQSSFSEKAGQVKSDMEQNRKKEALGKYVTRNILSPDDKVIAQRGEIITGSMIEKAEKYGMGEQVLMNASEKPLKTPQPPLRQGKKRNRK